jgi:hypothetical protein
MLNQFQNWQSGGRNLLRGNSVVHEGDVDFEPDRFEDLDEITFIFDNDDPEEDLEGYDLVYIGTVGDNHLHHHHQQQRKLSLANNFVNVKEDPKPKDKPAPIGKDNDQLLPFGRRAQLFNQVIPPDGSIIGTVQAFGAQVKDADIIRFVSIQFRDHNNKQSRWKELPKSGELDDWFLRELSGFPATQTWKYRMKGKSVSGIKEITSWMELAINIVREDTTIPTLLPTPNPTPKPSPNPTLPPTPVPTSRRPTSSPTPGPSPHPTLPPSPQPTPGLTRSPTRDPTPHPVESAGQWTAHPTDHPTTKPPTKQPTSPPSNNPTSPPTNKPTKPPTIQPTSPPTIKPMKPPTIQPTSPPTPAKTEAVQQAPPQFLLGSVRDAPWEYGGKCI